MKSLLPFSFILALGGLASCSTTMREDPPAEGYTLGRLPSERWTSVRAEKKGYHFFQNERSGAMIGLDSLCRRYQESSLETLSKSLTRPLDNQEITLQKRMDMDGREALETRVRGTLDGIPVEALFVTYRKNNCLFDFSLIEREKISAAEENDFRTFLKDFRFEGSGR